jgi:hypothetical protein
MQTLRTIVDFLSSSYGPHGRTKVVQLSNGHCIITRDDVLLLDALIDNNVADDRHKSFTFEKILVNLLLKDCKRFSEQFGSGSVGAFLVSAKIIMGLGPFNERGRANIRQKEALQIIQSAVFGAEQKIHSALINCGIWQQLSMVSNQRQLVTVLKQLINGALLSAGAQPIVEVVEEMMVSDILYDL